MADATSQAGGTPEAGTPAAGTPAADAGQQPPVAAAGGTPASFDEWLSAQDESTQKLIDAHVAGLKSTVASLREESRKREKDYKALARGAEDGSALKAELEKRAAAEVEANARAEFAEEAASRGIVRVKAAYIFAKTEGLIDEKGRVDFDELKKQLPELFAAPRATPPGRGGAGKDAPPPKLSGNAAMNDAIRRMAGIT